MAWALALALAGCRGWRWWVTRRGEGVCVGGVGGVVRAADLPRLDKRLGDSLLHGEDLWAWREG